MLRFLLMNHHSNSKYFTDSTLHLKFSVNHKKIFLRLKNFKKKKIKNRQFLTT